MPETLALTRLAITSSRTVALILLAAIVLLGSIGLSLEFMLEPPGRDEVERPYALLLMIWGFLPAGLASFVLFDFSSGNSVNTTRSNSSEWILRSPIASWKIAVVPLLLKTIWISVLWLTFVAVVHFCTQQRFPLFFPCIGISSVVVWLMAIACRPLRYPWLRLLWLGTAAIVSYGFLLLLFAAPTMHWAQWRSTATQASQIFAVVSYCIGVIATIRSTEMARTAPDGIIVEHGQSSSSWLEFDGSDKLRNFASPTGAFAWHEFAKTRERLLRTIVVAVIPMCILAPLVVPFNAFTYVLVITVFATAASAAVSGHSMMSGAASSNLPPFLVRSPIPTATMAWTRFMMANLIMIAIFACIIFVFAGWLAWPSNRATWMHWAGEQAAWLGLEGQVIETGVRLSLMNFATIIIVIAGTTAAYWWTGASGRDGLMVAVVVVNAIIGFVIFGYLFNWFMSQTDWESTKESARRGLEYLPLIAVILLSTKLVASLVVSAQLLKKKLASLTLIGIVWLAWAVIVLPVAYALAMINPIAEIKAWHCAAFVILFLPLARVLLLPIAMSWNRHR